MRPGTPSERDPATRIAKRDRQASNGRSRSIDGQPCHRYAAAPDGQGNVEEGDRGASDRSPVTRRLGLGLVVWMLAFSVFGGSVVAGVIGANNDSYPSGGDPVLEDHALVVPAPGVLANDDGASGTLCVTSFEASGLQGSLGPGVAEDGSFTFTPTANWNGTTTFIYGMAALVAGVCPDTPFDTATVSITVASVNDPPVIALGGVCNGGVTVAEDSGAFDDGPCVSVQSFGPDEGGQGLDSWSVSTNHPELFSAGPSISVSGSVNGRLGFTPASNAHGSALVTVRGRDDGGTNRGGVDLSAPVTFAITINSVNDAPTASPDSFIVLVDRTLNVNAPGVLANDGDLDGDSLAATRLTSPAHGVVTLAANGGFSYTPATGFIGVDAFSYRATDGSAFSATRVVTLNVTGIPTPPPTVAPPTSLPSSAAPSGEATLEPQPSGSPDPSASLDPDASPAPSGAATAAASSAPGSSQDPEPTAGSGELSIPVLVVLLLFLSLMAFGAAVFVPKWLESRRTGEPLD